MIKAIWRKIKYGWNSYREVAELMDNRNFDLEGQIQDAIETETTSQQMTIPPSDIHASFTHVPGMVRSTAQPPHWNELKKSLPITLIKTDKDGNQYVVDEYEVHKENRRRKFKNKKRRLDI